MNKGEKYDAFRSDQRHHSCQNLPKFEDKMSDYSRKFYFKHEGYDENEGKDLTIYATMKPFGGSYHGGRYPIATDPDFVKLDGKTAVSVLYDCSRIPKEYSHAFVQIELSNGEEFRYFKQCHPAEDLFWTHFIQFLWLALVATIILMVGAKMGKLSLFERIDEYRFDYYSIQVTSVVSLIIFLSILLVVVYILLPIATFIFICTLCLWFIALLMCLFLFMDFIDWIFNIQEPNEFEGSGHFMDQACIGEGFNLKATISLILSVALISYWYYSRYWLISNVLAIWVSWSIVKIFRFNALYPAYLVLLGFLAFDIFWVFVGPILFSGNSIIHEVLNDIRFPLKIAIPGFSPFVKCGTLSIIDIVVPTFYISFISRFGKENYTSLYYIAHLIVYCVSLGIVTCVMVYTQSKQPALMYIVPWLFIWTFIVSLIRGEWKTTLSFSSTLNDAHFNDSNIDNGLAKQDNQTMDPRDIRAFDKFEDEDNKENKN